MRSPVLLLVFNRPETTARVFEAVRAARPPRLYVAADGPRPGRQDDAARCAEARRVATAVDWPCEVKTLFREGNLGCGLGPAGGIDWFFENEGEGIILEDDILPLPSFFPYCDELLERFRHDDRVGAIAGSNPISYRSTTPDSYFFSRHVRIWGWATWRRAWKHYDFHMRAWPEWRDQGGLASISDGSRRFESYWRQIFERTSRGDVDWWDYQWFFACWRMGMLGVIPAENQIRNLGFGAGGTHTLQGQPAYWRRSVPRALTLPLRHPPQVARDPAVDRLIARAVNGFTFGGSVKRY